MVYFHEVTLSVPASPAFPPTSSTSSASVTRAAARPTPPPQSAQHEDEDEDLHDDSLPLMDRK